MKQKAYLLFWSLVTATVASASTEWFVRTEVLSIKPSGGDYSREAGYGILGGAYLGEQGQHELSVEANFAKWNDMADIDSIHFVGHEKYANFLFNYRYHVIDESVAKNTSLYVGPSIGATRSEVDFSANDGTTVTSWDDSAWRLSWGGSIGLLTRVTPHWEIDLGYRYLLTSSKSYTFDGLKADTGTFKTHSLYLGVGYRF